MESRIGKWDRLFRALFVALAVGLGWGIRGSFGHLLGAMVPGAALGLGFAYVTGQKNLFKWMPLLGALGGLGISLGGMMSYGLLHGYAKSDSFVNYSYGFFTLILEGGAWGAFGGVAIGLALERKRLKFVDWVSGAATAYACGWVAYHIIVTLLGFHINPPRSDISIGFTGAIIGLFVWLVQSRKPYGFKGALFGYIGFGLGMALGRLFANISYHQSFTINHWNIMEVSAGFIGGLIFTYGMLGKKFPDPPEDRWHSLLSKLGIVYVMAAIPLYHRIRRIQPEKKLEEWTHLLKSYGYNNPTAQSEHVMATIHFLCILGFIGAAIWLFLYMKNKQRFSWFPILYFSGLFLLIQNTFALYFYYPPRERFIDMHTIYWVMYGLMILFAIFYKRRDITDSDEVAESVNWRKWVMGSVGVYILIIVMATFVNGKETMVSACTRFPVWSWRDGPR